MQCLKWGLLPIQVSVMSMSTKPAEITVAAEISILKCGWVHRWENPAGWTPLMKICISKRDKNPSPHLLSFSSFPNMEQCPGRAAESTARADTSGMQGETPKKPENHRCRAHCTFQLLLQGALKLLSGTKSEFFFSEVEDDNPKDHRTLPEWPGVNLPRLPLCLEYAFYCF